MSIIEKLGITKSPWWNSYDEVGTSPMMMTKICRVHSTARGEKDELKANAQLIATAPEMLEALIDAAETFEVYSKLHMLKKTESGDKKAKRNEVHCQKLISIIEKATNKSWEEIKELL